MRVGVIGLGLGEARIESLTRRECRLTWLLPESGLVRPAEPALGGVTLLLGHPRPPVFSRLLRDCASWGLKRVLVADTELSEKSYSRSRAWDPSAVRDALHLGLQQGGLVDPPEVAHHQTIGAALRDGLGAAGETDLRLVLLEPAALPSAMRSGAQGTPGGRALEAGTSVVPDATSGPLALAVGPERGFTEAEVTLLLNAGFQPRSLGSTVLRTEVAVHAALGALSAGFSGSWYSPAGPVPADGEEGTG